MLGKSLWLSVLSAPWLLGVQAQQPAAPLGQQLEATQAAQAQVEALEAEYSAAMSAYRSAARAASSDAEREAASEKFYPRPESFVPRFCALAQAYPRTAAALRAWTWIAIIAEGEQCDQALAAISADFLEAPELAGVCAQISRKVSPGLEAFLRTTLERSPLHEAQGQACYALARNLGSQQSAARSLQELTGEQRVERRAMYVAQFGEQLVARLETADPAVLGAESERLLERVVAEFAELSGGRGSLGDAARASLFELRNLAIGLVAPEIEGEDLEGVHFKLSDYRGKVVVLDFWGHW